MKRILKIVALCTMLVMLLQPVMALAAVEEPDDGLLTWEEVKEIARLEAPATKAYEEMIASWTNDDTGDISYPESYSGAYISDNYNLVVNLVGTNKSLQDEILTAITDKSVVEFQEVDISRQGLLDIAATLAPSVDGTHITSIGISPVDSAVHVYVCDSDNTESAVDSVAMSEYARAHVIYKTESTSELTGFYQQADKYKNMPISKSFVNALSIIPGELVYASDYSDFATFGWYGTFPFEGGRKNCYMLAAHFVETLRNSSQGVKYDSVTFTPSSYLTDDRYCYSSYYDLAPGAGANGDYALIYYNNLTPTNQFMRNNYTATITLYDTTAMSQLGRKTVYKAYGKSGETSGYYGGTTEDYDCILGSRDGNPDVTGLFRVTPFSGQFSVRGDSGAPVMYINASSQCVLLGFITGGRKSAPLYSYCTPISAPVSEGFEPCLG